MKTYLSKLRHRLAATRQHWCNRLAEASVRWSGRFLYKAHTSWLADRSWLAPYERYLEPDGAETLQPTRILDRRFTIVQFAAAVRALAGSTAECGVFRGVGSALICKTLEGTYRDGRRHFGFDSFEGLSEPNARDRMASGKVVWKKGHLRSSREAVQEFLQEFPFCQLEKGWIPDSLAVARDEPFRLAHIDVDLHDPTKACLEFFYPRLVRGGILLLDDYGSAYCPGARAATDEFFQGKPDRVVELVTGQAFVVKL